MAGTALSLCSVTWTVINDTDSLHVADARRLHFKYLRYYEMFLSCAYLLVLNTKLLDDDGSGNKSGDDGERVAASGIWF